MLEIIRFNLLLVVLTFCVSNVNSLCPYYSQIQTNNQDNSSNSTNIDSASICTVATRCKRSRYRSIDGLCNNLKHSTWGAAQTPYATRLPYKYGDGLSTFARSVTGGPLPNVRVLRRKLFPEQVKNNADLSLITMQWGQVVVHDMSLTSGVPQTKKNNLTCCDDNGGFNENSETNPLCAPIRIFKSDPVYGPINKVCMDFVRTRSTKFNNCSSSPLLSKPLTAVSGYMDLSIVYGNLKSTAKSIREFASGRLRSVRRNGQEWPPQDPQPFLACDGINSTDSPCYLGGDVRFNQNTQLTLLQVVLLREHNRIADVLSKLNPHWGDETIFQEARRILIAIAQRITYYQYLPIILGYENMVENKLIYPQARSYVNDYDRNVDASVLNEHATSSFRYFHTNIQGTLKEYLESRTLVDSIQISDHFNNPYVLEQGNNFSCLARGMTVQPEAENDKYFDEELTERLFKAGNKYGDDLRAIDIQRSRDHGIAGYRATRAAYGLSVPETFSDMTEYIPVESVKLMEELYASIEDVDLLVGGALEYLAPNAQFGPTFRKISTYQFYKTRVGDRFFFENGKDKQTAFELSQLQSIREGASLARLLCDNVPGILSIQSDVFKKISDKNPLVPCCELPAVNLNLWKKTPC